MVVLGVASKGVGLGSRELRNQQPLGSPVECEGVILVYRDSARGWHGRQREPHHRRLGYPPELATPITNETLMAVRALTAWVLQRERAIQAGSAPPSATEVLESSWRKYIRKCCCREFSGTAWSHVCRRILLRALIPSYGSIFNVHDSKRWQPWPSPASPVKWPCCLQTLASFAGDQRHSSGLQTTGSLIARGRGDC